MDSDDDEVDFPTAELDDPVWSEEPLPTRQQFHIYQIPCWSIIGHTPTLATQTPQPIQEEVVPEP